MSNEWKRPSAPPNPLFFNKKELDFQKQISSEILERISPQTLLYYALDVEKSNYNMYGECINKIYLPPIKVNARVEWEGNEVTQDQFGIDRVQTITVNFHTRRIHEDQNLEVCEGDIVVYSDNYFEITELNEPQETFAHPSPYKDAIVAKCRKVREDFFAG